MEKNTFLVKDSSDYNVVYFAIELANKENWLKAKDYMYKKREEDEDYEYMSDSEIIEEYFQENNIEYTIIYFNDELYL